MNMKLLFSKPLNKQTLADKLFADIQELILDGRLEGGAALPSEQELAKKYGVSRAVVRDGTRMLMAVGLVEIQHGKGVFVTPVQNTAFGQALLLALKRSGATVWDVEHFEMILFPEVVALAASEATEKEIGEIRTAMKAYLETYNTLLTLSQENIDLQSSDQDQLRDSLLGKYQAFIEGIFLATHNLLLMQLAPALLMLRNLRDWQGEADIPFSPQESEAAYFETLLEAIESRDPDHARKMLRAMMVLPEEAIRAMKNTPVGEVPIISD